MDGTHFQSIGRIDGHGNSNEIIEYEFSDLNVSPGIYFYQLKQVDFDGTTEYHSILSIQFQGDSENEFIVYPNPSTSHKISIRSNVSVPNPVISIHSLEGKLTYKSKLSAGSNWSLEKTQLNLNSGTYFLKIHDEISGIEIGSSRIKIIE